MKHHSYTGGSALGGGTSPYLNFQTIMNNTTTNNNATTTNNNVNNNYQKFIEHTATGLDRGTSNITAEEIAALYSNVLATQTIINGKRNNASIVTTKK